MASSLEFRNKKFLRGRDLHYARPSKFKTEIWYRGLFHCGKFSAGSSVGVSSTWMAPLLHCRKHRHTTQCLKQASLNATTYNFPITAFSPSEGNLY
jgi:hypothetical protein